MEVIITPTYNPLIGKLNIDEVKRYAGLKAGTDFPVNLLTAACRQAQVLAKPKAVWQLYPYNAKKATILAPSSLTLTGASIYNHLAKAIYTAVITVTIGSLLETDAANCFSQGEYTKGLLIDAAGTAAVEVAADQAVLIIAQEAANHGCQLTSRYSPGYGDFDIKVQPTILHLANAKEINVSATASAMLSPRKSITALIGLVPYTKGAVPIQACHKSTCLNCKQINCIARKEN
jgi:hypothetical protein